MKKIFVSILILLCLSFSIPQTVSAENIFKQGVYTLSNLNHSPENLYEAKNISSKEGSYIAIFDEENIILQTIRLSPNSECYNLVPLKKDYKVVLLGKGEVYINTIKPK